VISKAGIVKIQRFKNILAVIVTSLFFVVAVSGTEKTSNTPEKKPADVETVSESVRPWWLGDLITIFGIFAGAGIIFWQLGRQHKNELKIQKENYREQLRLQIYQEFSEVLEEANNRTVQVGVYVTLIPMQFRTCLYQVASGIKPAPLKDRITKINDMNYEASNSVIKLIRLFEKYEIICPELDIFKTAVNVAKYDMSEAFLPLHRFLGPLLPMDIVDAAGITQVVNVTIPTEEQITKLEELAKNYKDAEEDLGCYLYDLNVELQNIFLSSLFDNKVKRREPIDPNLKVITTDSEDLKTLKKYFEEETAWGQDSKETEKKVRESLNSP
jgi:hypothetical protein